MEGGGEGDGLRRGFLAIRALTEDMKEEEGDDGLASERVTTVNETTNSVLHALTEHDAIAMMMHKSTHAFSSFM